MSYRRVATIIIVFLWVAHHQRVWKRVLDPDVVALRSMVHLPGRALRINGQARLQLRSDMHPDKLSIRVVRPSGAV